ncbi:MMPL family transporter [Verrucomicrobiales bacterium BCK34]|nr:MMPL family transporter [Verrucomicrobiales bacterium BCK34]
MLNHWITILIRGRWIFATILIAAMAASLWIMPELNFSFNLGRMLRGDEARVDDVKEFYSTFPPSDGHVMLSASADRTLTVNDLRATEAWADQLRALPEVKTVISPNLLLNLKLDGFTLDEWARLGGTGSEPLVLGDGPGMETFKGNLISRDLKSVALYLVKEKGVSRRALHDAVERTMNPPWPDAKLRIVGTDYLLQQMGGLLRSNFRAVLLLEVIALLLIIPFFMRSLRRAYLPVLISWAALSFYLSIFILAGQKFGPMHLAGPGLILIIGLADAIHLQQKFDDARAEGLGIAESLRAMFRSVGKACALTSLTTVCGFLSLLVAQHEEIYDFGIWCAIGVATAYVTVIVFLPVALIFFPGKGAPAPMRSFINTRVLRRFAAPVTVLLVILAAGVFRTKMDSSLDRELPESLEVVQNGNWFAENFRGLDRIEVDLHADLRDPKVFTLVERMQNDLRTFPGISGSRSYVDAIQMTLAPDVVETEDGPMLGVQALGSGGAFPETLLNRDLDRACIVFYRTRGFGTDGYEAFRDRVANYADELPGDGTMKLNGSLPMFYDSTTLMSKTMVMSLACSLAMITIILIVVLRSAKLALLCLVPNAIPLLVVAGISGWMGASLHLGILIVFSIGLGLAVDDTIHLMVRFKQLQKEKPNDSHRTLMDEAIVSTGFAIVLTSVVLLISAACFLSSSFTTLRWTGVTLGIVAITALLADLIVLPWLIEKFNRTDPTKPRPAST